MEPTRLSNLNLNALVALNALLSERHVSRAARRIGITQPAMSQALARLRDLFGDPLLVRKGREMVLTPRGTAMLVPLADALVSVERAVQLGMGFEPATSTRIFRIALSDLTATTVLPSVLRAIADLASGIRVQVEALSMTRVAERLASGELDLALAVYIGGAEGLRSEVLTEDDYVCLVRRGHALARRKRLRISDYANHRHLAYTPLGFVPRPMASAVPGLGSASGIEASVPYLLALPDVVRKTDLVATVPRALLSAPIALHDIVTLQAPTELPPVVQSSWWHPRFDRDPANEWLREQVRSALA
jgi:DNA-binding transcriptional LysR family regulator